MSLNAVKDKENPYLRGSSVILCSLLVVRRKSHMNGKACEFIIKHVQHPIDVKPFLGRNLKQNHEGLCSKWIIP